MCFRGREAPCAGDGRETPLSGAPDWPGDLGHGLRLASSGLPGNLVACEDPLTPVSL